MGPGLPRGSHTVRIAIGHADELLPRASVLGTLLSDVVDIEGEPIRDFVHGKLIGKGAAVGLVVDVTA